MNKSYFMYRFNEEIEFNVNNGEFVTIMGNNNDLIIKTLLFVVKKGNIFVGDTELNNNTLNTVRRRMSIVLNRHLNIFVGETVKDEIAFGLESLALSKDDISNLIETETRLFKIEEVLERDPNSLGVSDKVKMKILSSLIIKPRVLVIDNLMCELDYEDKLRVFDILDEYVNNGGIVLNFTNDVEETLYGKRIIIIDNKKLICDGKTISVLNEEKILKRLGLGLPFIVELNKYLMDYELINNYHLTNKSLVGALWK